MFLEKYLNMAHYVANLLLSQATYHMGVTPYGEKSLKTCRMFCMNYPNSNASYQVKQNSYQSRKKGKLQRKFKISATRCLCRRHSPTGVFLVAKMEINTYSVQRP